MRDFADFFTDMGRFEYDSGDFKEALSSFLLVREIVEKFHYDDALAPANYNLAITYFYGAKEPSHALECCLKAEKSIWSEIAKERKDGKGEKEEKKTGCSGKILPGCPEEDSSEASSLNKMTHHGEEIDEDIERCLRLARSKGIPLESLQGEEVEEMHDTLRLRAEILEDMGRCEEAVEALDLAYPLYIRLMGKQSLQISPCLG